MDNKYCQDENSLKHFFWAGSTVHTYIHTYFIRPKRAFRNKDTLINIKLKNIFTTQLVN